jgi:hypothetical protein
MKKFILSTCFLFTAVIFVSAQHAAERKAQIKQGLKEEVKLTDDQATSVMAIVDEFRPKLKAIRTDSTLSDEEKKTRTKVLNEEKTSRIESVAGKELAQKIESFYAGLKKNNDQQKPEMTGKKKKN